MAYRSEWKAEYKSLSQEIRSLKSEIKDLQKHREYAGAHQNILLKQRALATEMLEELKQAKIRAQEQYLASRQLQTA